jgi:hypothetical protein
VREQNSSALFADFETEYPGCRARPRPAGERSLPSHQSHWRCDEVPGPSDRDSYAVSWTPTLEPPASRAGPRSPPRRSPRASAESGIPRTRRRARLASRRAVSAEVPTIGAISSYGTANMSCSKKASRSAGVSVSNATNSARPTDSAWTASSSVIGSTLSVCHTSRPYSVIGMT